MWGIEYFLSDNGRSPVKDFIESLDAKSQARIARDLDLLEEFGIKLGMPYARYLEKDLWELRIRYERNRYRIIYFLATGRIFIMLHGFSKKTGPVLRADIEIAKRRQGEYFSRKK